MKMKGYLLTFLTLLSTSALADTVGPSNPSTPTPGVVLDIPNQLLSKLTAEFKFCAQQSNAKIRLECYEQDIKEAGIPIYNPKIDTNSLWVKKNNVDKKDWLASIYSSNINGNNDTKTSLNFRCEQGHFSMYLKYSSPVGSKKTLINMGLSDDSMGTYTFSPSENEDALGLWDSNQAILLSKYIANSSGSLIIKTHFNDMLQVDTFNLDGSRDALTDVRRACGW